MAFADGDLLTLPLTASNRSIAAVLVGFVLLLVGLIGVRRKRH
ncbi:LPXTG cell wall anchor domain-containing protein [Streptococcus suis]